MSHFFPQSKYPEDQPLAHTILTTHVLYRGFQAGTGIGLLAPLTRALIQRKPITAPLLLRSAGVGGLVGTGAMAAALFMRMRNRELIEWKDRSWALLHNEGQVRVDNWSQLGMVVGGVWAVVMPRAGWRGVVGGAGLGSLVGTMGSVVWGMSR